jgi:cytidylate kinase
MRASRWGERLFVFPFFYYLCTQFSKFVYMIITIARQCGCGAVHVGEILAEHYGIPFYTRQNLLKMAEEKGFLPELADFFEERPVDELRYAISEGFAEENIHLHDKTIKMLEELVGTKSCIIIGRCGNYIFRKRKDLVSIFLKGDIEARVKATMKEEGMSEADAREFVDNTEDCRIKYHKYYTGLTWGNAADYDLCLDSCRLTPENTALIIEEYIELTARSRASLNDK